MNVFQREHCRSGHRQKEPWPPFQFRYSKRTSHLPVGRKTSRASRCLHHKCAVKMVLRTLHPNPTQTHNIIIYIAPKIFPMVFGNGQDSVAVCLGGAIRSVSRGIHSGVWLRPRHVASSLASSAAQSATRDPVWHLKVSNRGVCTNWAASMRGECRGTR